MTNWALPAARPPSKFGFVLPKSQFGFLRPVLIWPAGLSERLNDAQIASIVAHELEHVRRREPRPHIFVCSAFAAEVGGGHAGLRHGDDLVLEVPPNGVRRAATGPGFSLDSA